MAPKIVTTTLDANQYTNYYNLGKIHSIEIIDTWYCPGDTSRRPICKKPKLKPSRSIASPNEKRLPYNYQPVIPR